MEDDPTFPEQALKLPIKVKEPPSTRAFERRMRKAERESLKELNRLGKEMLAEIRAEIRAKKR